jgi:hypothetical protein
VTIPSHEIALESTVEKNSDDEVEKRRLDLQLDKELQDAFPASDALKITPRQTDKPKRSDRTDQAAMTEPHAELKLDYAYFDCSGRISFGLKCRPQLRGRRGQKWCRGLLRSLRSDVPQYHA